MISCTNQRTTRLGPVQCGQPADHNHGRSDHVAEVPDPDDPQGTYIVSWHDNYPNAIQIDSRPRRPAMACFYDCDRCGERLRLEDITDHYFGHDSEDLTALLSEEGDPNVVWAPDLHDDPQPIEPCS